jgi:hypothetical protein
VLHRIDGRDDTPKPKTQLKGAQEGIKWHTHLTAELADVSPDDFLPIDRHHRSTGWFLTTAIPPRWLDCNVDRSHSCHVARDIRQ